MLPPYRGEGFPAGIFPVSRQPHTLPPHYPLPSGLRLWSIPCGLFDLAEGVRGHCRDDGHSGGCLSLEKLGLTSTGGEGHEGKALRLQSGVGVRKTIPQGTLSEGLAVLRLSLRWSALHPAPPLPLYPEILAGAPLSCLPASMASPAALGPRRLALFLSPPVQTEPGLCRASMGADTSSISGGRSLAWRPRYVMSHGQASNLKRSRDFGDADDKV